MNYTNPRVEVCKTQYLLNVRSVAPSKLEAANRLAASVSEIAPCVWLVGLSTVDMWKGKCTCKESRTHNRTCAHQIAVFIVTGTEPQFKLLPEMIEYFSKNGIKRPFMIGYTCRLKSAPGRYKYRGKAEKSDWLMFQHMEHGYRTHALPEDITHLQMIYGTPRHD